MASWKLLDSASRILPEVLSGKYTISDIDQRVDLPEPMRARLRDVAGGLPVGVKVDESLIEYLVGYVEQRATLSRSEASMSTLLQEFSKKRGSMPEMNSIFLAVSILAVFLSNSDMKDLSKIGSSPTFGDIEDESR